MPAKPFQKGNKLGKGRPPLPEWARQKRKLTQEEFFGALSDICRFSTECVRDIAADEHLPIKTTIMANWLLQAIDDGYARRDLLDRLYGKPKESFDITTTSNDELIGEIPFSQAMLILRNKDKLIG